MDYEVELNYRLTGHLQPDEIVLATIISPQLGIFAATDRRILGVHNEAIGYGIRVYAYSDLQQVDCVQERGIWCVAFRSAERRLCVPTQSRREARRFAAAVSEHIDREAEELV